MIVRRFNPSDLEAVRRIHAEAFRSGADAAVPEVTLFDALLGDGDVIEPLSLVVGVNGAVVGHVVCSRATIGLHEVAGLGPIGVLPSHQGAGFGSALMHAVLGAADAIEYPLVALLGSPAYYARFGFVPASSVGIEAPDPAWVDHFQVRLLRSYCPDARGQFRYAPAFALVS